MLVVGGEEEGSCIASIRRAINLLNAFLLEAISEQHGEVISHIIYHTILSDQVTELLESLLRRPVNEVVQVGLTQDDCSREHVHSVEHSEIMLILP